VRAAAALDLAVLRRLRTAGHSPASERWIAAYSKLGSHAAVWLALGGAGMALDAGRRRRFRRATATVMGAYALNTAMKLAIGRRRPELPGLPPLVGTPTGLSFPSAHATTSFAGACALGGLLPSPPLYLLAATLALSRPWLGVHYPSDVLAGAALGALIGRVAR